MKGLGKMVMALCYWKSTQLLGCGLSGFSLFVIILILLDITKLKYQTKDHVKLGVYTETRSSNWEVLNARERNEKEYFRFAELMANWPADKPKAVIHYLIGKRDSFTNKSLQLLFKNFNNKFKYPVIIFHEADLNMTMMSTLRENLKTDLIILQQVEFRIPSFVKKPVPEIVNDFCVRSIGYRHMCRFHAKTVYDQRIMRVELEYAWRLDDDSFIHSPIKYDVFKYMKDNGFMYGFRSVSSDSPFCVLGLWFEVVKYAKSIGQLRALEEEFGNKTTKIVYNNFEISALSIWQNRNYTEYFDYIDRLGGIYHQRWGDAPIKTYYVIMFLAPKEFHQFKDIHYEHLLNHLQGRWQH